MAKGALAVSRVATIARRAQLHQNFIHRPAVELPGFGARCRARTTVFPQIMRLSAAGVRGRRVVQVVLTVDIAAVVTLAAGPDRDALSPDLLAVDEKYDLVLAGLDLVGSQLDRLAVQRVRRGGVARAERRRTDREGLAGLGDVREAGGTDLTTTGCGVGLDGLTEVMRQGTTGEGDTDADDLDHQVLVLVDAPAEEFGVGGNVPHDVAGIAEVRDRRGRRNLDLLVRARLVEVRRQTEVDLGGAVLERDAALDDLDLERATVRAEGPVQNVVVGRRVPDVVVGAADDLTRHIRALDLLVLGVTRDVAVVGEDRLALGSPVEATVVRGHRGNDVTPATAVGVNRRVEDRPEVLAVVVGLPARVTSLAVDRGLRHRDLHVGVGGRGGCVTDGHLVVGGCGSRVGRQEHTDRQCRCGRDGRGEEHHGPLLERKHLSVLSLGNRTEL